jgi:hypothetical protein
MEVEILPEIYEMEFSKLYHLLNQIKIPMTNVNTNRRHFPYHKRMCFGLSRARFSGIVGLSRDSIRHPEIFEEVTRIGDKYIPFKWTSVHLNHNVTCPPHRDDNNNGKSLLVSFGKYIGGNIVIENIIYDAWHRPIIFDGNKLQHWNTPDLEGNKYSLVYYINDNCSAK